MVRFFKQNFSDIFTPMALMEFPQSRLEADLPCSTMDNCAHSALPASTSTTFDVKMSCHVCDFSSYSLQSLNLHLMNHAKFFTCEIEHCHTALPSRRDYIRHMKSLHGIQGKLSALKVDVQCRVCKNMYSQKIVKGFNPTVCLRKETF